MEDARALLEVSVHADEATIGRAYRRSSLKTHPDRGGSNALQKQLTEARDLILAALVPAPLSGRLPAGPGAQVGGMGTKRARARGVTGGRAEEEENEDDAEVGGRFEAEADDCLPEGLGGPKAEAESRNRKPKPKPRRYLAFLLERVRRIFSV